MRLPLEPRRRDFTFSCLILTAARAAREACGLRACGSGGAMKRDLRTEVRRDQSLRGGVAGAGVAGGAGGADAVRVGAPGAPHLVLEMWVYAYDAEVYWYDAHCCIRI
jgi:hypothetical protein